MKRNLHDSARAVGGLLTGANASFGEVSSDSRTLEAGSLFVALRGPNFDGSEFTAAAAARGAVGALVERAMPVALPQIVVPDALVALQQLAQAWRAEFRLPVVAVAGSNGKTTAKEMTAAILARGGPCLATRGNLNNHIGVPLTLLRLAAVHRSAVIEMGARTASATLPSWSSSLGRPSGSSRMRAPSISNFSATWMAWPRVRVKWSPVSMRRPWRSSMPMTRTHLTGAASRAPAAC